MTEITIRHSRPEDLEGILAIYSQPHAYGNTLQLPLPSQAQWTRRLAEPAEGTHYLVAEDDGVIVGQLTLIAHAQARRKHVATFGMGVRAEHTGQGVGSRLLEHALDLTDNWLNVHRVEIEVYVDNEPAVKLYEKFGFEVEGRLRDYAFREGVYVDAWAMARLRPA